MRLLVPYLAAALLGALGGHGFAIVKADTVSAALDPPAACPGCWGPAPTTKPWQWQLSGRVDTSVKAPVYDVDGQEASAALVTALHARGRRAICYFNAGAWEPFRPDAASFPRELLGKRLEGFEAERWLDIRRIDLLAPIMRARLDDCAGKGFDAVEPDNVDGYANRTGFKLSGRDQLGYNAWLANEAHARKLAVGLKNDADQVKSLVGHFDFAVVEQCFQYDECRSYSPFVKAGKAVFEAEYELPTSKFCNSARRLRFSAIRKRLSLKAFRQTCPS